MKDLPNNKLRTIQEVAEHLGVSTKTLRRWEKKGKITPIRTAGNQRRYSLEDIELLKNGGRKEEAPKVQSKNKPLMIQEVAEHLGVSTKTLRRWEAKGKIKPLRTAGNQRRYTIADIRILKSTTSQTGTTSTTGSQSSFSRDTRGTRDTLDTPPVASFPKPPLPFKALDTFDTPKFRPQLKYASFIFGFASIVIISTILVGSGLIPLQTIIKSASNGISRAALDTRGTLDTPDALNKGVLAITTSIKELEGELIFRIPVNFGNNLSIDGAATVSGTLTSVGDLTAPNVVYSIVAGDNVTIEGDPQNPTISASVPTDIVTSFQGLTGAVTLTAGEGISISGTTISSDLTIPTVVDSGWTDSGAIVSLTTISDSVGIGTDAPSTELEVVGTITSSNLSISSLTAGSGSSLCLDTSDAVVTCTAGSSSATLQSAYDAGNTITGTTGRNIQITFADLATDQTFEITQAGTADAFRVNDDGTFTDTTPFVIDQAGNVGIGTATPSQKLDIADAATGGYIRIDPNDGAIEIASGNNANSYIDFKGSANLATDYQGRIHYIDGTGFDIQTAGSSTPKIRITESGNVGIGDATPAYLLTVGNGDLFGIDGASNTGLVWEGSGADAFETTLTVVNPTADIIYRLADASAGTYDLCSSAGNCLTGGGAATLQTAYNAGNTITTTTGRDIEITLADVATDTTFEITQAGTDGAFAFRVNDDGTFTDTTPFVIDQAGNVGIGTTSPSGLLHVTSDSGVQSYFSRASTDTSGNILNLRKSRGTHASPLTVASGDNIGDYSWEAYEGDQFLQAAIINAQVDGTVSDNIIPTRFRFYTTSTAGTLTERMRIDSAGNVGIGVTSPTARLEVGNGTDSLEISSVGDLLFVDANDGASITGPAGGALAINAALTGLNLQADGSIDVNLAGGSGATGCTVANTTGNLTCTGSITGSSSGTVGYWSRSGTTLSPATSNDIVSISGNSGDILTLASSATGASNKALNVSQTGATSGTDYAGYFSNTGAATTNVGLYATATGATNNYAAIFEAGNVGIGTTTPIRKLHVTESADANTAQIVNTNSSFTNSVMKVASTGSNGILFTASADTASDGTGGTARLLVQADGNVGVGDASPLALFTVGDGDDFQISSTGNLTFNQTAPTISIGNTGSLVFNDGTNTLCTIADAGTTGNLTCTGSITGASTGTVGYWSRSGTTLSPATANDIVSIANTTTSGADFAITNTGVYTGTGIFNLTANSATSGTILNLSATGMTGGKALNIIGPSSTGVATGTGAGWVHIASDVASSSNVGALVYLAPDFSGSLATGYGLRVKATDTTSNSNNDYGIASELTLSGATNAKGIYSSITSTSTTEDTLKVLEAIASVNGIITTGTRSVYGLDSEPVVGAESTGGTTNVYGIYSKPSADVGAGGTVNSYGLYIANGTFDTDGTSTNTGLYVESPTGADNNYAAIFAGGNVGIGTTSPGAPLQVVSAASATTSTSVITHTGVADEALRINITQADDADATDTSYGIRILPTSSSGDADFFYGLSVGNLSAGTATETAIRVGTGWDQALYFDHTSPKILVANNGAITFTDAISDVSTNNIFTLQDVSNASNHILYGDSDTGLELSGATIDITTTSGENLGITAGGTGDVVLTTDANTTFQIAGLSSASGTALCLDGSNNVITCASGSGSSTLQSAYNTDADGSDAIIALTTADDSLIFRNPASGGTDSVFVTEIENLETGNTDAAFKTLYTTSSGSFNTTSASITNYGGYFSNTSTESAGSNTLTNVGLYATATGADNNYAAIFEAGNVGIGTTTPTALLELGGTINNTTSGEIALSISRTFNGSGDVPVGLLVGPTFTPSGNINTVIGSYINPFLSGTSNVVSLIGQVFGTNTTAGYSGALQQTIALSVSGPTFNGSVASAANTGISIGNQGTSGTTTAYGLYIEDQSGSGTNIDLNFTGSPIVRIGDAGVLTFTEAGGNNTLCTLTDSSNVGNLSCTGNITGASTGTVGYWSRSGTTLSPATSNDIVSISGNSGDILTLASSATGASNKALNVSQTGATSGTDYAGYFSNTGAATTNVGLYATATGATNNYAAIFEAGNVGIGTTSPSYKLDIASSVSVTDFSSIGTRIVHTDSGNVGGIPLSKHGLQVDSTFSGTYTDSGGSTINLRGLEISPTFSGTQSGIWNSMDLTGARFSPVYSGSALSSGDDLTIKGIDVNINSSIGTTGGTSKTGGLINVSGTADTNYGLNVSVSGATNNYAAVFGSGNVGIGDSSPAALFTVGNNDMFQVDSSGILTSYATGSTAINLTASANKGIQFIWPSSHAMQLQQFTTTASGDSLKLSGDVAGTVFAFQDISPAKLAFFGATLATQPSGSSDVLAGLVSLGLRAASSNPPLNLGTGAITAGASSFSSSSTTDLNKTITVTQTGATVGTDYAGHFSNTGAATTNVGLYATATGATNNYAAIFEAGNVGIGTTTPTAALTVRGTSTAAVYGSEKVTNGSFTGNATGWTLGTGWAYNSNNVTKTAGTASDLEQNITAVAGETYTIAFDISGWTAGCLTIEVGGVDYGASFCQNVTTARVVITATTTGNLKLKASSTFAGTIDNVSAFKVTPTDSVFTMQLSDGSTGLEVRTAGATDSLNTFVGLNSGRYNENGTENTALGAFALQSATRTDYNTAIGVGALKFNTNGDSNTAVGDAALLGNTYGEANTALGQAAHYGNVTGNYNTAIGVETLLQNEKGDNNVAVGYDALVNSTSTSNSTAIGYFSLGLNSTGVNNIALGYQAGDNITTGSNNLIIGYDINAPSATSSNQMSIGNMIFGTGLDGTGTTISTGSIGIRDASPDATFDIDSAATTTNALGILNTSFTTGEVLDITTTHAPTDGSDNEALDINLTYTPTTTAGTFRGIDLNLAEGANALANTLYGFKLTTDNSANTSTGTHTIYGGHFTATGKTAGTTTAVGLYSTASGADSNYAAIFDAGNVGIGTTTPSRKLDVTGTWGGNTSITTTTDAGGTTAVTDAALVYFLRSTDATATCDITKTFNITGLSNTEGSYAHIVSKAVDGGCATGSTSTVVQINTTTIATVTNADTGGTSTKNYTVAYVNSGWVVVGYSTSDTGADLAEWIPYTGDEPQAGEVLVTGDTAISAKKSEKSYDPKLLGVVTTDPHTVMGADDGHSVRMALAGRVPVKVSTEGGAIQAGDYITSSSTPGVGMKATRAGQVIGKALDSFSEDGIGKVMVLVDNSYVDPNNALASLSFDSFGNLILPTLNDPEADAVALGGSEVSSQKSEVKKDLGWNLADIVRRITNLESRISNTLGTQSLSATDSAKLEQLNSSILNLKSDATDLKTKVASLEATLNLFASGSALLNPASSSAELGLSEASDIAISDTLSVGGRTTLTDVGITGKLTVGLLTIDGLSGSRDGASFATINTTSGPLKLQSDGFNGIDILDGKITIDTSGNMKVDGELTVKKLKIDTAEVASASLGKGILESGDTKVVIQTTAITDKSKVFITPKTKTTLPLSVTTQATGSSFTVEMTSPTTKDIEFNWWVVN